MHASESVGASPSEVKGVRMSLTIEELQSKARRYSEWSSPKGMNTQILPWRLWDKGKRLHWDPADIDFTQDAKDWQSMTLEQQLMVAGLARGFMVGEEGVTLDILPLVMAMADEGRAEETMFLTQFAYEEAKHVDFFARWFAAIGADPLELEEIARQRAQERGMPVQDRERSQGLFESQLPQVMRRLLTDRSPKAFLDASVTYNQFIEGCLAIAGYRLWNRMFTEFGVLQGLREGLGHVQDDERRHIAYGTFLTRRIIAAHNELADWARDRMYELRDTYFTQFPGAQARLAAEGNGQAAGDGQAAAGGGGYGGDSEEEAAFSPFIQGVLTQVDRRVEIFEKAKSLSPEVATSGAGSEEIEEELEKV